MKSLRILLAAAGITLALCGPVLANSCVLRQSDAVEVVLGPYVDATDGVTAETGLTISQGDVILKKCTAGGDCAASAQKNDSSACAHDANGMYECDFNTTDTDTVGILEIWSFESGAAPVWLKCLVVEEAVYDELLAASALGYVANAPVNVAQFGGSNLTSASGIPSVNMAQVSLDAGAADNIELAFDNTAGAVRWFAISDQGLVQSGSSTSVTIRAGATFAADELICSNFAVVAGTGVGQKSTIEDNDASDGLTLTTALVTALDGTSFYQIYPAPCSSGGAGLDAAGVRSALGMSSPDLDTQLDAIVADTAEIGVAGAGLTNIDLPNQTMAITGNITGNLSGSVGSVTGAVGSVTGAVGSVTGAVGSVTGAVGSVTGNVGGNVTGSVGSVAAGGITSTSMATDTIGSDELATGGIAEIVAAQLAAQNTLTGTCDSGSTTTCVDNALTQADATQLEDRLMCFDDGWCGLITTFTPGTDTATTTKIAPSTRASKVYTIFPSTLE